MSTPVSTTSRQPRFDEAADLRHDLARRHRARRPAAERNDAERAAVIAAVLHLHVGARARSEAVDEMSGRLAHAHDVVDLHALGAGGRKPGERLRPHLLGVADDVIDFAQRCKALGLDLRGAAGDDDARRRVLAAQPADGLRRLAHGLGGDGASVDDDRARRGPPPRRSCASTSDSYALSRQPSVMMRGSAMLIRRPRRRRLIDTKASRFALGEPDANGLSERLMVGRSYWTTLTFARPGRATEYPAPGRLQTRVPPGRTSICGHPWSNR